MILTTPEILWHAKEPIFSVEFHHGRSEMRLVTAGADHTVKVSWYGSSIRLRGGLARSLCPTAVVEDTAERRSTQAGLSVQFGKTHQDSERGSLRPMRFVYVTHAISMYLCDD